MTSDDAPAPGRRALRDSPQPAVQSDTPTGIEPGTTTTLPPEQTPSLPAEREVRWSPAALSWVDEAAVAAAPAATRNLDAAASPYLPAETDLLAFPPRRSPLRAGVIAPILVLSALVGGYAATTLLWPLHAIPPEIDAVQVDPVPAPPAALNWPGAGSAAVSVAGIGAPVASATDAVPIASITKVVTALLVLDEMPLAVGESGPEFRFTAEDSDEYWNYLSNNESALDVPVDGTLSEYQLLQGMLIGSAGNYADRLAGNIWPSDAVFARAAESWLDAHGVSGITIVEPTGIDPENAASPDALLALGTLAMANPVIAEIVATQAVEIPGAGLVTNTNGLLADAGVLGIKTGSLDAYTLLSAKNIQVGDTTVRAYASVLGQPDDDARLAASRQLYSDIELALQPAPSVTKGTVTGHVTTAWGEKVDVVTSDDANVILWNSSVGAVATTFSLGDALAEGEDVGTLTVQGPLNTTSVALELAGDIDPPTGWWRLTHPLDLFGLN